MHRNLFFYALFLLFIFPLRLLAQTGDTIVVQTLTLDSVGRAGYYHFPDTGTFEKVLMEYTMRCHNALVSNDNAPNQGCGQWDYNCESYIWDSTRTDSLQNEAPSASISNYPASTSFPYTTVPTSSITRRDEKLVTYPQGTSFTDIGSTKDSSGAGFEQPDDRTIFVLPAGGQILSRIQNGISIQGLTLNPYSLAVADTLQDFRIRIHSAKAGSYGPLSIYSDTNFVEVFHSTIVLSGPSDPLFFYQPMKIDTGLDLVVELSYSGMTSKLPFGLEGVTGSGYGYQTGDAILHALSFAGSEFVPIPVTTLDSISNAVTIAFWAYGDTSYLPGSNCVLCEALGTTGNREMNIHLPWSDDNVYWDCGGDSLGNFDRIQKVATKSNASGRWNHWAFTKDAVSGKMAIYLNGSLWMSDTGNHRLIHATEMLLGGAASSGIGYFGDVRQFTMFNRALDSSEIVQIMMQDSSIGNFSPVTQFTLDEGSGTVLTNSAAGMPTSKVIGVPVWHTVLGKDLPNNFSQLPSHPRVSLIELSDTAIKPQIADSYIYDTIRDHAHIVTNYRIGHNYALHQNDTVIATDTVYGDYLATKSYTYDETGNKIDSTNVAAQDTVKPQNLFYFTRGPQKFELMSFVTPYGLGLDMGKNGKTWEFDVTDYVTEMKGWKRLTMERGSGQEEFDLKFLFIKGTPARNVLDMDQIWPMTEESYQTIQANYRYQPITVDLLPNAKAFKIRSYITGHGGTPNGLNGEFTPQWHDIFVDTTNYRRFVYKICSLDPLYPQGGTWTLNRAGWCPGMATDLAEYEITGTVKPGSTVTMDYNVEGGVGDSRYDPSTQLVSYGPPNFAVNASIEGILRPSPNIAYGRINPACDLPIVFIKNNGSDTLKSLQFEYYTDSGEHLTYNWAGTLPFLDTASVTLPIDSLSFWGTADTGNFHVDISQPNGTTDQYDHDDHYTSQFTKPPTYNGIVVVNLYTNNDPQDNYYEVLDMAGDTVFSNGNFDATTSYFDSLILPVGCYTLRFHDDGQDGLSYWANTAQGNGYLRLRQTSKSGKVLETFNPDFGMGVQYDFSIGSSPLSVDITQPMVRHIGLYPNPATTELNYDLEGMPVGMITVELIDATGNVLHREQRFTDPSGSLHAGMDVEGFPAGSYFLHIVTKDGESTASFIVQ